MNNISNIVFTRKARCRDCNRCVRVCPVNAIKIENAQAQVIAEKCIDCGYCVSECPQEAKSYTSEIDRVRELLTNKKAPALSLAPSFAAYFPNWQHKRLISALRQLGFDHISETAVGAWHTATESKKITDQNPDKSFICTACPSVVAYVEKYKSNMIDKLLPIASPLIAHARILKSEKPARPVVFAGPCIAKIKEIKRPEFDGLVQAAITFEELTLLLEDKKINIDNCEESDFDMQAGNYAPLFPIEGGLLRTGGFDFENPHSNCISMSGAQQVIDAVNMLEQSTENLILEPLFCEGGCINGPLMRSNKNIFSNSRDIINYNKKSKTNSNNNFQNINYRTTFSSTEKITKKVYSDQQIREVLEKTGKASSENELNCGGCGYNSCRDKAIAVLDGVAEVEMCIPYMRRLAEDRSNMIFEKAPNAHVILDYDLRIKHMNPAFKKLFSCSDAVIGQNISYLTDVNLYEKLLLSDKENLDQEVKIPNYNIVCQQLCYKISEEKRIIGVYIDISKNRLNEKKLKELKTETILRAHELIEHQIKMAQEQARFLGENTAKGELLLQKLIDAID